MKKSICRIAAALLLSLVVTIAFTADVMALPYYEAPDYAVGSRPYGVVTGDFNLDGNLDLATANQFGGSVSVLLGNGDGTFQAAVAYSTGECPWGITTGDFNLDGRPDLATANYADDSVSVLLGNGDGTFQGAVNYGAGNGPMSVASGDFNGNGIADLAVANRTDNNVSILLNTPEPPVLTSLAPDAGMPGQTLTNVIITGIKFTGATVVNFGAGITVNGLTVNSDT